MAHLTKTFLIFAFLFFTALAAANLQAQTASGGSLFTVNDTGDSNDSIIGDGVCLDSNGKCTLRAAIDESNASVLTNDVINFTLPIPSVINLTLGELKIRSQVNIVGPGARRLTVQRSFSPDTPDFGIFNVVGNLKIRSLTISNGKSTAGGIYIDYNSSANLNDIVLSNNSGAIGGAIGNIGIVIIQRSLIVSNTSTHQGGGLVNLGYDSSAVIVNSTITNNTSGMGGGLYNNGRMLLINNTISHNTATYEGSGINNALTATEPVNVFNTIIGSNNISTTTTLAGGFVSLGNNIVTDARNSTGFANGVNSDQVSDNNAINPLLGNLADNGGQIDTRVLIQGSPAINQGNNCVTNGTCSAQVLNQFRNTNDQRKYSRYGGIVDVGAFEFNASAPGIGSLGFVSLSSSNRQAGALAIMTNARTGEKKYGIANPIGNYSFTDLTLEVYILEIKSKRAGLSSVLVFEFDTYPFTFLSGSSIMSEDLKLDYKFTVKK